MEPDIEESYPRKKILLIFIPPSVELFAKLELHRRYVIIYFIFIQAFTEHLSFTFTRLCLIMILYPLVDLLHVRQLP